MDHEKKVRNSVLPGKQCLPVRRKTCPATYFPRAAMTSRVDDLRRLMNDLIRLEEALAKRWDGSKSAAPGQAD
ncbi:hypothetical protein ACIQUU_04760 [Streptomyces sp. NPDC101116]|uniref:hypothetical protein n=1 Tax=Streptomyces sp. NPDC101116 TaxID=3366107 RepID=UPI0037F72C4A